MGDAAGVPTRLPIVAAGSVLASGADPAWTNQPTLARVNVVNPPGGVIHVQGGNTYDLIAGGSGYGVANAFMIQDLTLALTLFRLGPNGAIYLTLWGGAAWGSYAVQLGGVDSGGAGFRTLLVPNNPS